MIMKMRNMMKRKNNQKGFTLIELIVVMAILAVLAAIAVPRYNGIQDSANQKAIIANLKTIDSAVMAYAAQNNTAASGVTQVNLAANLIPTWPTGPSGVTYAIDGGNAEATIPATAVGGLEASATYRLTGDVLVKQ